MHDLSDVRYVRDLIQNLISLEALESTDLVITLVGRTLNICLYSLVAAMDTWRNNLQSIQQNIGDGGATTVVRKIGEFVLDTTD